MKKLCAVMLFLLVSGVLFAQERGLAVIAAENLGGQANIGKQYALFVAIDAYRSWPALKKPVSDAREIRDILNQDYHIDEVIELHNQQATRQNIARTFTDLQTKLNVHDSLFIYYAGHGHYDKSSDAGFWIPVDGGTDIYAQENWLPNSQIRGYISRFKTIHVFMVSDACFSGDILNTTRALPPQIDNAYYRRAYSLTSRQVLTSGSSETVPDQSEFSSALIHCLRKNTNPLLDPIGIYNDVRLSVRKTTPLYGSLNAANHQDGATFLFFRRQAQPVIAAQPTIEQPSAIVQPAPLPPSKPVNPAKPVKPPKEKTPIDSDATRLWSLGASVGTSFVAPVFVGTVRGTIAPLRYSFLEIGFDAGVGSGVADVGYYALFPFVHYAFFLPFPEKGGWYIGAGGGYMWAQADFPEGRVPISITGFGTDAITGVNLFNMIDISYTVRADFSTMTLVSKLSVGYAYRFK